MGIIRRNRVERYVALSQKQYIEQKRRRTSKVKTKCCCCCQEGEQEEMFSKFASLLTFAFVVLLALSSTTALAQGDGSADQVFAGKSPDFEKRYCKEHAGDKACHDWCKQHPKQDVCLPFIKQKREKKFCQSFCDQHPKKCGTDKKKNQCAYSTYLGATNPQDDDSQFRSAQSGGAPNKAQVSEAFNSLLQQDGSSSRPGELPISDLKPLLKDLGVDLNKEDFKHVKQKLNNGGYFNLVSFFFFWSEFVICEAISG